MDNAPSQTGYNTEMKRVEIMTRMDARTNKPHPPRKNKSESVIKFIKGNSKGRSVQRNIPNTVWDFGMEWETEKYSCTAGKDGRPSLERLTSDTIDIYKWLEYEFYELVFFWNNHSDDTKPMLG